MASVCRFSTTKPHGCCRFSAEAVCPKQVSSRSADFIEQPHAVGGGGLGDVFQAVAAQLGNEGGGVADVGRFVGFAAFGHGREVGGVGFHQQPVERHIAGGFLDGGGVFEGDDA